MASTKSDLIEPEEVFIFGGLAKAACSPRTSFNSSFMVFQHHASFTATPVINSPTLTFCDLQYSSIVSFSLPSTSVKKCRIRHGLLIHLVFAAFGWKSESSGPFDPARD